jgi:hypothetical protein
MRPPFPWPCNQRSLPWRGDQIMAMSYRWIPMNIMGRLVMRPPILLVRSCFIIFLRVPSVSCREAFYCLLGDPLGEASLGFIVIARFVGKVRKLELGLETGVTGASPPTVTSMGSSFYLGGQVQGRRP